MKVRTMDRQWMRSFAVMAFAVVGIALLVAGPALAADNVGTGDIGGDGASLNDSNTFSLFTTTMSLNKMAFLSNGTQLTSGATLPRGSLVDFVIYIDNTTAFPLNDVSIQDVLDPTFAYQSGSMRAGTLAAGSSQALIYSTISAVAATLSDTVDADEGSAVGVTITAGTTGGNGQVDVAPSNVWAILFRALMQ